MRSGIRNQLLALVTVLVASLTLGGCSEAGPGSSKVSAPEFEGPYASEFEAAFLETKSERARDILRDGEISEMEYTETIESYGSCLTGKGIDFKGFNDDFSHRFKYPESMSYEEADRILNECAASTGEREVTMLYAAISMNPENRDVGELQVECFLAKGIVPKDYTVDDWREDVRTRSFPIIESPTSAEALSACEEDPLGAVQE